MKDSVDEKTMGEVTHVAIEENTLKMKISSVQSAPAYVTLLVGPKSFIGLSWSLVKPVTTFGRSHRLSDALINHDNLSKSHFQIMKKNDFFYIIDLESTNKTYKNEEVLEPYKEYKLSNNDYIRASDLIFKFLKEGSVESISSKFLLDKAYKDSLTGAGNRQYLQIKGKEFFKNSKKLSLIVFDIDKFKFINDNYGHLAGDYVLKTIVELVQEAIRKGDILFRYGGDEFCIFTPSSINIGKAITERILENIKNHSFVFKGQPIKVSISVGLTSRQETDKKWEDIYSRADEDCYKIKKSKK